VNQATLAHRWERLATQPEVAAAGWFSDRKHHESRVFAEGPGPAYSLLGQTLFDIRDLLKLHREKPVRLVFEFEQGALLVSVRGNGFLYLVTNKVGEISVNLWSLLESD